MHLATAPVSLEQPYSAQTEKPTHHERQDGTMIETLTVESRAQGLKEITGAIAKIVSKSNVSEGLCTVFIQHTSASLTIQENADPTAKRDLEQWLNRLVPEDDELYTHVFEGPDDMPSHIKAILTATSLNIPILNGKLALGTWQGIYLWEHRTNPHSRRVIVRVGS